MFKDLLLFIETMSSPSYVKVDLFSLNPARKKNLFFSVTRLAETLAFILPDLLDSCPLNHQLAPTLNTQ